MRFRTIKGCLCSLFFFLLIALLTALPGEAAAQKKSAPAQGLKLPVQCKWARGETSFFNISRTEESVDEDYWMKTTTRQKVRLKVLDKTDTSFTIEWFCVELDYRVDTLVLRGSINRLDNYEEIRQQTKSTFELFGGLYKGMKVVYQTDGYGEFQRILNRDELTSHLTASTSSAVDKLVRNIPGVYTDTQRDSLQAFFGLMITTMAADEDFDRTFEEIQLLHFAHGYEFELGSELTVEGELPNPIGETDFPSEIQFTVEDYNSQDQSFHLKVTETLIEDRGIAIMNESIRSMMRSMNAGGGDYGIRTLRMKSDIDYFIDLRYGWLISARLNSSMKMDGRRSTTEIRMELVR